MDYKFFWIFRAIYYKLFFKRVGFPSYIGKPIFLLGRKKISLGKKVRIYPMCRMEVHGDNSEIMALMVCVLRRRHFFPFDPKSVLFCH